MPLLLFVCVHSLRINLRTRLLLTVYFSLLGGTSIAVMLLAMTFNVYIIAAILVGEVGPLLPPISVTHLAAHMSRPKILDEGVSHGGHA